MNIGADFEVPERGVEKLVQGYPQRECLFAVMNRLRIPLTAGGTVIDPCAPLRCMVLAGKAAQALMRL